MLSKDLPTNMVLICWFWYEVHETMESAIQREKAIKEWQRAWKLRLIEERNPNWDDLYDSLL